jgi:hypothetical protein
MSDAKTLDEIKAEILTEMANIADRLEMTADRIARARVTTKERRTAHLSSAEQSLEDARRRLVLTRAVFSEAIPGATNVVRFGRRGAPPPIRILPEGVTPFDRRRDA